MNNEMECRPFCPAEVNMIKQITDQSRIVLLLPSRAVLHYSGLSGIRLTRDDSNTVLNNLGDMPGPLIVAEADGQFLGITWEPWSPLIGQTKPGIQIEGDTWKLIFPAGVTPCVYPAAETLAGAVIPYAQQHASPAPPGWQTLKGIKRAVYLDMWQINGTVLHDYDMACRLLRELDHLDLAKGTLLYLPGWHAPYDTRMPAWKPADELGGPSGFRQLVDLAKSLGAIIMPHMNFWGYDRESGLLDDWEKAWSGYRWPGNVGICPGYPIEYMLVDDPRWICLFDSYFDRTVESFGLDAVFLDQCGNAMGHATHDMAQATRGLLERIHRKYPDLLLGAEVLNENIVDHVPLIQATWLMEENIGRFSPIAKLMFKDRVRFIPHLFLAAARPCRYVYTNMPLIVEHGYEQAFAWYQQNNRQLGTIPSVRLDYRRSGIDPCSLDVLKTGD